ncbi:hypothetical protein BB559_001697 [Furculomyces boomerangus]|uniref:GTP cyclohydrolase 1 n=1 Tax=Furculomyces boomerangus TaxID=61424 RepID=A0A2T9Z136_9FUNG|nr:hypothetical protein BB559_001697 [Furculomyces boomerangus]
MNNLIFTPELENGNPGTPSSLNTQISGTTPISRTDSSIFSAKKDNSTILQDSIYKISPIEPDGLSWPAAGTRTRANESSEERENRVERMKGAIETILECIGEDPNRKGIVKTPERYAKALLFFTTGYEQSITDVLNEALFEEDHEEMVIVKDILTFSLCEHHLVPFQNKIAIGYIPNRNVLGLSKLARLAEMFSRRLQVQERLTKQIAIALNDVLKPQGVAVLVESSHQCMSMRGVQKPESKTITSYMVGQFRDNMKTREEFLSLVRS